MYFCACVLRGKGEGRARMLLRTSFTKFIQTPTSHDLVDIFCFAFNSTSTSTTTSTRPFPATANDDKSDGNPRTTGKPGEWLPTLLLISDLSTQHDGHNNNKDGNQVHSPPPHCSALTRPRSTTTDNDATTTRRGNQVHSPPPHCSALTTMTVTRPA